MSGDLTIRVLGKDCPARPGRTILNTLLLNGHRDLRNCGCRLGDCGECVVTLRRQPGGPLEQALSCIVEVEDGMEVLSLPFPWTVAYRRAQENR